MGKEYEVISDEIVLVEDPALAAMPEVPDGEFYQPGIVGGRAGVFIACPVSIMEWMRN